MSENDSTPGARKRKSNEVTDDLADAPLIKAGEVYWLPVFKRRMGMNDRLWSRWQAAGFRAPKPGTKKGIVIADDAIEFIRQHPELMGDEE